jgi:hypothetical protein
MKRKRDLVVKLASGDSEYILGLTNAEFKLLGLVDPTSFLLIAILRPPRSMPDVYYSADQVREGLVKLNKLLSDELLFYTYQYYTDAVHWGDSGPHVGPMGSFHLGGDRECTYSIDSGIGFCKLTRRRLDASTGRGLPDGEIDIRDRETIETDETGKIRIERKPVAKQLRNKIRDLMVWAESLTDTVRLELASH